MPRKVPVATGYRPVTVGRLPTEPGRMQTQIHPPRQRTASPVLWALISGIAGLLANVLLAGFFSDVGNSFSWLGTANDWVLVVQFLAMIPVALALRRWLPFTRSVRVTTAVAVGAMVAVGVLHLLLIAGVLDFDRQVLLGVAAFLLVYVWVFVVSSIGHRQGTLPRSVTRFGLLLGASFPVGWLITAAGYLVGSARGHPLSFAGYLVGLASGHPLAFAIPGLVVSALSWLALPVWPLILARLVFSKPASLNSDQKGLL